MTRSGPSRFVRLARAAAHLLPRGRSRVLRLLGSRLASTPAFLWGHAPGGVRLWIDPSDPTARTLWFHGVYEPVVAAVMRASLRPGDTLLDVGANLGAFSLPAASWVAPSGRVFAFEPDARNLQRLRTNVGLNPDLPVVVVPVAVSDGRTGAWLASDADRNLSRSALVAEASGAESTRAARVPTTTLDGWCAENGVRDVALVKMDIEGAEALAVRGMQRGIGSGTYRRVVLEVHPPEVEAWGATVTSLLSPFRAAGYGLWRLREHPPGLWARYGMRCSPRLGRPLGAEEAPEARCHLLLCAPGVEPPWGTS